MSDTKVIKRPRINKEDFIKTWARIYKEGGSQADVAKALGCTPAGVATKCKKLIEEGVNLPELKKRREDKTDVAALNKLLRGRTQ
jgi:predicted transcriptional regulator